MGVLRTCALQSIWLYLVVTRRKKLKDEHREKNKAHELCKLRRMSGQNGSRLSGAGSALFAKAE